MKRKRNADKESHRGSGSSAARNMIHGGGGGNNSKFSEFEFDVDDWRVEFDAQNILAKFRVESPSEKPVNRRKSIDKYVFLECFANGVTGKQKHSGNDVLDVDSTDGVFQDRTSARDIGISSGPLNCEPESLSSPECQCSDFSCGAKSSLAMRNAGRHTPRRKHNKTLHLDSDGDERLESGSLGSPIHIEENDGSLKEQSSEYGANNNDCEAVVIVAPYYVKYGNFYYTRCRLIFSQRCITLEGSSLCDRKGTLCFEWSTFDILKIEHQKCESANAEVVNLYLGYRDANADETGSVELEFVILDDPQCRGKLEQIKSLDLIYEAAWETSMSVCLSEEPFEEVVYPDGDPDAVFISKRDIELLKPRTFINDTIIDFYIKYILNKTKATEKSRFHFFNTFFFQKLDAASRDLSRVDAFQSVCKWTRNVNIFEKDYIFIPVNFSLHWSLIIICQPGEIVKLRNKDMDEPSKIPCILHMDSIRGLHRGRLENLIRCYLWEEWKDRGNEQEGDISLKFRDLDFLSLQVPQQENLSDCGLFLLHYAELFLELASNGSTTNYIDFLNQHWFLPAEVSLKKRDHIRKLIYSLVEDKGLNDPPAASNNKYVEEPSTSEGERSAKSVPKNSGEEETCCFNFYPADYYDFVEQQQHFVPMIERRNIGKSATKECWQRRKRLVPVNQFNNSCLPMEVEVMESSISQAEETSEFCSDEIAVTPKVAFCREKPKDGNDNSSTSGEDLAACVVEDSEDESEAESITSRGVHRPIKPKSV